ncbi:MAG: hypothetical protein NTV05_07580 [Acidobacteria bacterium]|nr:hypothetical protein [Acidobacteriota bacterium]
MRRLVVGMQLAVLLESTLVVDRDQPRACGERNVMRRADLAERIDTMEHRMDSMDQRLDASFNALMAEILQSRRENDVAHSAMRSEFTRESCALRGELSGELSTMRTEVAREFSTMRVRFESVETAIDDSGAHLEAAMLVLHEEVLSRLKLIGEGRPSSS